MLLNLLCLVAAMFFTGSLAAPEDIQPYFATPPVYTYSLENENETCLIAELAAEVVVKYPTEDGNASVSISLPDPKDPQVIVNGQCGTVDDVSAMISVTWNLSTAFTLNFNSTSKGNVFLSGLDFAFDLSDTTMFPNSTGSGKTNATINDMLLTMGGKKQYFQCHSLINRKMDDDVSVNFYQMKVQAFDVSGNFSKDASVCAGDETSTPEPKTTPTSGPVTTPAPTQSPTPPVGNWTVKQDNGTVCIVAEMALRFMIPYKMKGGKNGTAIVDLPAKADNSGSMCGNDTQILGFQFYKDWILELMFDTEQAQTSNSGKTEYSVHNVSLTYFHTKEFFPDAEINDTVEMTAVANDLDLFRASVGGSYICTSKTSLPLAGNVTMDTYKLHVQAFKYDNETHFVGSDQVCPKDVETNGIVPIAVGAALAALVFIVVIAYIIGRRRRYQGYEAL